MDETTNSTDSPDTDTVEGGADTDGSAAEGPNLAAETDSGIDKNDAGLGFEQPTMAVDPAIYPDLNHAQAEPGEPRDLRLLSDIELELCVEIGRARLPLRQLLALTPGSVVELDRALGEPVDVLVNGTLVGRGQIVTIGDEFGVRLSEIVDPSNSGSPARRRS